MTTTTNARLAGVAFLLYIVAGIASMGLGKNSQATPLLTLATSLCALTLGVTLYALTRDVDRDLALLALVCRVVEAVPAKEGAFFFAVGSTIFAWLLLKGRIVPAVLAQLGIAASALLVVVLPLQRFLGGGGWASKATWLIWMPALVYELWLAFLLLIKGVKAPAASPRPAS